MYNSVGELEVFAQEPIHEKLNVYGLHFFHLKSKKLLLSPKVEGIFKSIVHLFHCFLKENDTEMLISGCF